MKISRRNFLTKLTVGVAGLSLARDFAGRRPRASWVT